MAIFLVYQLFATLDTSSVSPAKTPFHFRQDAKLKSRRLRVYGDDDCVSDIDPWALVPEAVAIRKSCRKSHSALSSLEMKRPKVATVSAHITKAKNSDRFYQKAIQTHLLHRIVHRSHLKLLCSPLVDALWNKEAFILSILTEELVKPPERRLEWIFWADRDSVILDYCRDATDFLPRSEVDDSSASAGSPHAKQINLLIANDRNGLNDGTFLLRVGKWAIDLLSDTLAFPRFKPDVHLTFTEQSAMENLLREDRYKDGVRYVPQHWFNAWPQQEGRSGEYATLDNTTKLDKWAVRRGDFLVHFAGCSDKEREVTGFTETARQVGNVWESGRALRDVSAEIAEFWSNSSRTP
ncbi:hypothetical protein XA68_11375 [Ophiocordyceps unilateralis]|uniref:Galactosyl transferase GMA12/MNN10 family protein n=1 Tax=Ophiocordyceps unilateralis TaxID=268505 RepID=A0A2A9PGK9_OPHUN|nr:hypothetical protein XA68_11375 [Ophiocordyceps unilateralis]